MNRPKLFAAPLLGIFLVVSRCCAADAGAEGGTRHADVIEV